MNCHICNQPTKLVVQSPNLQYNYCVDCKVEPKEVLNEPHRRDDEQVDGHMLRWSPEKGWEASDDGQSWVDGNGHSYTDDEEPMDDRYDYYGGSQMTLFTTVSSYKDNSKPVQTDEQLQLEFEELLKRREERDENE